MAVDASLCCAASDFIGDIYPCDETIFLIFGYGSLIWKQEFPFTAAYNASLYGYQRLFYQGTKDHRGTPEDPGRVVTLLPAPSIQETARWSKEGTDASGENSPSSHIPLNDSYRVDGKAFQLPSDADVVRKVLEKLDARETGYKRVEVTLMDFDRLIASGGRERVPLDIFSHKNTPKDMASTMMSRTSSTPTSGLGENETSRSANLSKQSASGVFSSARQRKRVVSLVYIATEESSEYLGSDTMDSIAETIWRCHGKSGANKDYLFRLASSLEEMGVRDPHVLELNAMVRKLDQERGNHSA